MMVVVIVVVHVVDVLDVVVVGNDCTAHADIDLDAAVVDSIEDHDVGLEDLLDGVEAAAAALGGELVDDALDDVAGDDHEVLLEGLLDGAEVALLEAVAALGGEAAVLEAAAALGGEAVDDALDDEAEDQALEHEDHDAVGDFEAELHGDDVDLDHDGLDHDADAADMAPKQFKNQNQN
jgi:hypothetical protein